MNKNLEELKRRIEIRDKVGYTNEESIVEMLCDFIPILEDFEKRLKTVEAELGIYTDEEVKEVKLDGTDPD